MQKICTPFQCDGSSYTRGASVRERVGGAGVWGKRYTLTQVFRDQVSFQKPGQQVTGHTRQIKLTHLFFDIEKNLRSVSLFLDSPNSFLCLG